MHHPDGRGDAEREHPVVERDHAEDRHQSEVRARRRRRRAESLHRQEPGERHREPRREQDDERRPESPQAAAVERLAVDPAGLRTLGQE